MNSAAISVRQLNTYVKSLLEGDVRLSAVAVAGEVTNFKYYAQSGHCYFTLKDEYSAVKCVMFKSAYDRRKTDFRDGVELICFGRISLYERDGSYQLYVENVSDSKAGSQAEQLEKLKQKLLKEGLLDEKNKRQLPPFPGKIAVITSASGAVLHDIISVTERRCPLVEIVLAKASVQGEKAESEMLNALDRIYDTEGIDVIIIGRGGGSKEDLDVFNSEKLARKIYESPVPVISAVGHETDYTVCDLVADKRAATPSAAAELAVPDIKSIVSRINMISASVTSFLQQRIQLYENRLKAVSNLTVFAHPEYAAEAFEERLNSVAVKIADTEDKLIDKYSSGLIIACNRIDALSPLKVMARGYCAVSVSGVPVKTKNNLKKDDILALRFTDGEVKAKVEEV